MVTHIPHKLTLRRLWPLLAILLIVIFPFGWLANLLPAFGQFTGALFPDVNAHAVGHTTIFLLFGLTLLGVFPHLRRHPWRYLALLLLAGLAQEGFQLAYKQRPIEFDEFRDLATDLFGGLAAFAIAMLIARWQKKRA
jgi:hypothetical protein